MMPFPHSKVNNYYRVHRFVILPEYQGIGVGSLLLNFVADLWKKKNKRILLTTSSITVNFMLKNNKHWVLKRHSRINNPSLMFAVNSLNRITSSWEYIE